MEIEKRKIQRTQKKIIKPARFEDRDTGDRRERTVIKENGDKIVEQVPITQRVFFEAVSENVVVEQEFYIVKTIAKKKIKVKGRKGFDIEETEEEHQFANEEDAKRFISNSAKQ